MSYTITRYARGTIWWCNLSEDNMLSYMQKGRRPVLIISDSKTNEIEHACTVLPISTSDKYDNYLDTHQVVKYEYNNITSYVMCNMPRRISTFKLDRYYGVLSEELFDKVMDNYLYYVDCSESQKKDNNNLVINNLHNILSSFDKLANLITKVSDLTEVIISNKEKTPETVTEVPKRNIVETEVRPIIAEEVKVENNIITTETESKKVMKNDPDNTKIDKSDRLSMTMSIRSNTKSNIHRGKDINSRRKNIFEQGYWQVKNNNIEFWNELLIGDIDSMIKKYKYKNRVDISRRKYEVKKFLLKAGYTQEQLRTFIEI